MIVTQFPDLQVELLNDVDSVIARTKTDDSGLFSFSRLSTGVFQIHWQLALLYNQLKRYKEAADELELFLKVEPDAKDTELMKKRIMKFRQQSSEGMKQ